MIQLCWGEDPVGKVLAHSMRTGFRILPSLWKSQDWQQASVFLVTAHRDRRIQALRTTSLDNWGASGSVRDHVSKSKQRVMEEVPLRQPLSLPLPLSSCPLPFTPLPRTNFIAFPCISKSLRKKSHEKNIGNSNSIMRALGAESQGFYKLLTERNLKVYYGACNKVGKINQDSM